MTPSAFTGVGASHFYELVTHLARRELNSQHRWTLLGWAWPLARQLAQLAVLVFVFSKLFDLGIDNYAVFVFTGLITFGWFSSGVLGGAYSLLAQRHLVSQPRFPASVVPVVAVAVPLVDVLMSLPVLVAMLVGSGSLTLTALLLPVLLAIQLVLMCGFAWIFAAAAVYLRDVPQLVLIGVTLLWYMTPVFYSLESVPERYHWVFDLNPLATLIEAYRAVLIGDPGPSVLGVAAVSAASVALAVAGLTMFRRLEGGFVDEL
ncbi:MAG TPA: ABC transporter permease [Thermoleophilaceae bacterium]|nr:ABC transporter permease [Thermoleophilaceae bacterium]